MSADEAAAAEWGDLVRLALMVAESGNGNAGPNIASVLAHEVRRLTEVLAAHKRDVTAGDLSNMVESVSARLQARISHLEAEDIRSQRLRHEEQVTLNEIEAACVTLGYDPECGTPLSEWIPSNLQAVAGGTCRVCGCTDNCACIGGCTWVDAEHTLCSECAPLPAKPASRRT